MEGPDAKGWSDGEENGLGLRIKRDRAADDGEDGVPVRRSPCAYVSFLFALAKSDPRAPRADLCRRHIQVLGRISACMDREDPIPGTCKDPRSTLVEHRALN
jgi:hypothetical protein